MWHDHPFSQRNKVTKEAVGGGGKVVKGGGLDKI